MNTDNPSSGTKYIVAASLIAGLLIGITVDKLFSIKLLGPIYSQSAAVIGTLFQNGNSSAAQGTTTASTTPDASSLAAAASTTASTTVDTSSLATGQTNPPPARYAYKLAFDVDPCTFNKLGADGWVPLQYGTDPTNNGLIENAAGRDETCSRAGIYSDFLWILFQKTLQ